MKSICGEFKETCKLRSRWQFCLFQSPELPGHFGLDGEVVLLQFVEAFKIRMVNVLWKLQLSAGYSSTQFNTPHPFVIFNTTVFILI